VAVYAPPPRILVLSRAGAARAPIAAALIRRVLGRRVSIQVAAIEPGPIDPHAIAALGELGVGLAAAPVAAVAAIDHDTVKLILTVCEEPLAPEWETQVQRIHWPIPDPGGTLAGARAARDELARLAVGLAADLPPEGFMIRPALELDREPVQILLEVCELPTALGPGFPRSYRVARAGGQTIGVVALEPQGDRLVLHSLAVAHQVRGYGLAIAMVARALVAAEGRPVAVEPAHACFERFGFVRRHGALVFVDHAPQFTLHPLGG
jgi:protein-tyrosine-phosphatase/N-acetylglutamate synthase-like GNAT family acetyltransferase